MSNTRTYNIKLYTPTPPQEDALRIIDGEGNINPPYMSIIAFGRQTGKTFMLQWEMFKRAMNEPIGADGNPLKILWISPTNDQCLKVMDSIESTFAEYRDVFEGIVSRVDRKYPAFEFHNGATIKFRSAEAGDNLRGMTQHYIYIDEAAYVDWSFIQKVLMPMTTRTKGRFVCSSTFDGRNWFWKKYLEGLKKENFKNARSIKRTYIDLNDSDVTETVMLAKASMGAAEFAQEYLCEPMSATSVFNNVDACAVLEMDLSEEKDVFLGADIGMINDATVLTAIDVDGKVLDMEVFNMRNDNLSADEFKQRILDFTHKWADRALEGYFEVNSNSYLHEDLCNDDVFFRIWTPVHVTGTNKRDIVSALMNSFDNFEIQFLEDEALVSELLDFEGKKDAVTGNIKYANKSRDGHDDRVMSLAHANKCRRDYLDGGVIDVW